MPRRRRPQRASTRTAPALGRIGADELRTDARAFAVGDRVVATRNDRSSGVVNGEAGVVEAIRPGSLAVRLDNGRQLELPDRYAREGHLDHGYAITAHRAQSATVDRAFVLGSDQLSREWGYTALSRHRQDARFYVCATPTFLNEARAPLQAGDDVSHKVARMLALSRAKHLAGTGGTRDDRRDTLADELDHARRRLIGVERRLDALRVERAQTRWYQRHRSVGLEQLIGESVRARQGWRSEVLRLTSELEHRPVRRQPEPRREPIRSPSWRAPTSSSALASASATSDWSGEVAVPGDLLRDDEGLHALAREVARLIGDHEPPAVDRLLTARQVAARFNVDRSWVYAHAGELGVIRLGDGPRPRLRFDPAVVGQRLVSRPGNAVPRVPGQPRAGTPLLPIKPPRERRTLDPD